jgi:hypothetical protein
MFMRGINMILPTPTPTQNPFVNKAIIRAALFSELNLKSSDQEKLNRQQVFMINDEYYEMILRCKRTLEQFETTIFITEQPVIYVCTDKMTLSPLKMLEKLGKQHNKKVFVFDVNTPLDKCFFRTINDVLAKRSQMSININDLSFAFEFTSHCKYIKINSDSINQLDKALEDSFAIIALLRVKNTFALSCYKEIEGLFREYSDLTYLAFGFVVCPDIEEEFQLDILNFHEQDLTFEQVMTVEADFKQIRCKNPSHDYWDTEDAFSDKGLCGECEELQPRI